MARSTHCRKISFVALFGIVGALVACSGCDNGGKVPVSGKVILPDGSPAAKVVVSFDSPQTHTAARSSTNEAGEFELTTDTPGDGAMPGQYVVTIYQPGPEDSSQAEPPRIFPKRYEDASTSGLNYEVKAGETNRFEIQLEAK